VPQNLAVIEKIIRKSGLHVQVGGGIRSEQSLRAVLACGARRAIVGTAALEAWAWFDDLVHQPRHRGRIGLALDAREGMLAGRGWTQTTARRAVEVAGAVVGWPLGVIVYTDISRDGMLTGPNVEATAQVAAATNVPVIASGGVGCIDDVRRLAKLPIEGIIIGRALYDKKVDLAEAVAVVGQGTGD
jgi:phosphoribosylformimino-5-aminoimidazole carboxamide ribotide isomerase